MHLFYNLWNICIYMCVPPFIKTNGKLGFKVLSKRYSLKYHPEKTNYRAQNYAHPHVFYS